MPELEFDQPDPGGERREKFGLEKRTAVEKRVPKNSRWIPPRLGEPYDDIIEGSLSRAQAAANLRLAMTPFPIIAKLLEYSTPRSAQSAVERALAEMNPPEDLEILRQSVKYNAEQLLARSLAMARAEFIDVPDEDCPGGVRQIRNLDRLKWHEQAGRDLERWATLTGARAAQKVEVSADIGELNEMVQVLLHASGDTIDIEAEIFDAEEIPDVDEEEI